MSNLSKEQKPEQECLSNPCQAVELTIQPKEKDLGGFSVRRLLPAIKKRMVGPWIFFDHMGPAEFPAGQGINVRPHPHINLATVTYLFEGEIWHRDSLGYSQPIRPGDINLMVAGSGIVHSERESQAVNSVAHRLHGLQLWMALPEEDEESEPAFYHYPSNEIPALEVDGIPVRIMIGSAYGVTSPVKTFADTLYVEALLETGQTLHLPEAQERAVYVASGTARAKDTPMPTYNMTIFSANAKVEITAEESCRIALIGGQRLSPRHMFWNFASSRQDRIEQAKSDWQAGRFPTIPGDDEEFIPLP